MSLDKALFKLEEIAQQEKNKKIKRLRLKIKKQKKIDIDIGLKQYLRNKEQYEYKNILRLKSKRLAKKIEISNDFDDKYKAQQENQFNKPWGKLLPQLKMDRLYRYLEIKRMELEWSINEYQEKLEMLKERFEITQLRKNIEYDEVNGEITFCNLIEIKEQEEDLPESDSEN
jgi:hypothetical protein